MNTPPRKFVELSQCL